MKKLLSGLLISLLIATAASSVAQAHVLEVDGDMGAILHVKPDDAPVFDVLTTYELTFQDSRGNFSLDNCECTIEFIANDQTVLRQSLTATSRTVSENKVTFPKPAVYKFRVSGTPKSGSAFKPFALEYDVRVGGGQSEMQPIPVLLWIGIGMGASLLMLYANTQQYGTSKREDDR